MMGVKDKGGEVGVVSILRGHQGGCCGEIKIKVNKGGD